MIERYLQFLGIEETLNLLKANEVPLTPTIRVNTLKIKSIDLNKRLIKKGFELEPIEKIPYGYKIIKETHNLGSTHEYLQGYYYLQNFASMLAAIILDPKPTDTVIDMCAAPGSKSTHIGQLMENKGTLILIERNINRISALDLNLRRMGIRNSIILNMDASKLSNLDVEADDILLDAPCTGEGLIRQDPRRKTSKKIRDIQKMASIQKRLLRVGLTYLKPGGKLLYCTCSIAPEENELVINAVLNELKDFIIVKIPKDYGVSGLTNVFGNKLMKDLKFSQRLYPHLHGTVGFYFCLIKRNN